MTEILYHDISSIMIIVASLHETLNFLDLYYAYTGLKERIYRTHVEHFTKSLLTENF